MCFIEKLSHMKRILVLFSFCFFAWLGLESCIGDEGIQLDVKEKNKPTIFTLYSDSSGCYEEFNSSAAINRIATIENEYFNNFSDSVSCYYGTTWMDYAIDDYSVNDSVSILDIYKGQVENKTDSMHCTIYAVEALKFGLEKGFERLERQHKKVWKDREYAGWSVGYLLVKYFNWKAYLFISPESYEYRLSKKMYNSKKTYRVWKQPSIPLSGFFNVDEQQSKIDSILMENEFGWGFSDQGWHTWITRYDTLKECNWAGAPSASLNYWNAEPLFKKTKFLEYKEYTSHIVVFPPKKKNKE